MPLKSSKDFKRPCNCVAQNGYGIEIPDKSIILKEKIRLQRSGSRGNVSKITRLVNRDLFISSELSKSDSNVYFCVDDDVNLKGSVTFGGTKSCDRVTRIENVKFDSHSIDVNDANPENKTSIKTNKFDNNSLSLNENDFPCSGTGEHFTTVTKESDATKEKERACPKFLPSKGIKDLSEIDFKNFEAAAKHFNTYLDLLESSDFFSKPYCSNSDESHKSTKLKVTEVDGGYSLGSSPEESNLVNSSLLNWLSDVKIEDSIKDVNTKDCLSYTDTFNLNCNSKNNDKSYNDEFNIDESISCDSDLSSWLSSIKIEDPIEENKNCSSMKENLNEPSQLSDLFCNISDKTREINFKIPHNISSLLEEPCLNEKQPSFNKSCDDLFQNTDENSKFSFFDSSLDSFNEFNSNIAEAKLSPLDNTQLFDANDTLESFLDSLSTKFSDFEHSSNNLKGNLPLNVHESQSLCVIDLSECIKKSSISKDILNTSLPFIKDSASDIVKRTASSNITLPALLIQESSVFKPFNLKQSLFSRSLACKTKSEPEVMERIENIKMSLLNDCFIRPVIVHKNSQKDIVEHSNQPIVASSGRLTFY